MLIEALVALALFGLVLSAVAEAHQTIARLSSSAGDREERERQLLVEHFKEPSSESNCSTNTVIPLVLKEVCCDLEVSIDGNKKSARACRLSAESGSGLLNFIIASFFLTLLASLSYPTIRQLMIERKESRDSHLEKLSVAETEAELQRVLFDNQVLKLPGVTRVIPISDPLVKPALSLTNINYRPQQDSTILITSALSLKFLIYPAAKSVVVNDNIQFLSCAKLPKDTSIVAGFSKDEWEFYSLLSKKVTAIPTCNNATNFTVRKLAGELDPKTELVALAPVKQSELYYLDNGNSLRRYSLIQQKTTPIDYGYTKFQVGSIENGFHFQLTKKNKSEERDFSFDIELEATDAKSLLPLLY